MKHKHRKRGHAHGKHNPSHHHHHQQHRHKSETEDPRAPSSPTAVSDTGADAGASLHPWPAITGKKDSVCEYCGVLGSATEDDEAFECGDDCDRFRFADINCVTSQAAFARRAAPLAAFYCECTRVVAEIHALLRGASEDAFNEGHVVALRPRVLSLFTHVFQLGVGGSASDVDDVDHHTSGALPCCPFVMLLSSLQPPIRKLVHWVQRTKVHWWQPPSSPVVPLTTPLKVLATQLELHDLLMRVTQECDRLIAIIEENEERDQDLNRVVDEEQWLASGQRSQGDHSSISSSSSASSFMSRGDDHAGHHTDPRLPQVKKIAREFDDLVAECKFELADLSEAMTENVDALAVHLCRVPQLPIVPKSAAATLGMRSPMKLSAIEFVEVLMHLVLTPLSQRAVQTPSVSRSYILPRLLDRSISVTITEFVQDNTKWTEIFASQFEKAIELFRTWSTSVDAEYDKALIAAPRDVPRLNLHSVDAFHRLDILLTSWLRTGKEGDNYMPRLTFRTNLEHLRSTIKRTMTARSNGAMTPTPTP